jgi:hypothetical protein
VDGLLGRALRTEAAKRGLSLNATALALLRQALGLSAPLRRAEAGELDRFAGTWSREEAEAFDAALREQRRIDPDLWK